MSGAVPPPAARPLERAARVPQPVCPGCGRCGRVDPAPAPQRAPLRAGVARCGGGGRASPGGVPSTVVRGAWCQALSLPRPPVLWSGQPGFRDPCVPGAVDAGVWTQHRPHSVRPCGPALLAVGMAEGRPRGGCLPPLCGAPGVRRCPSPGRPSSGAGSQGSAIRVSQVRSMRACGPSTGPTACALAGRRCSLWGWRKGVPGGGAFHRCEGRLVSGAVPPPAARPLERAARVPRPVCPGCGRCGRVDPAPAPLRAPLRAGVARCGGGGRASPGGVPSTVVRGAWCQALSLPRPPLLWSGQPGFRNPCVPGAVDAGVWTQHRPHSVRPCGPALLAVGVAGGRPRGGVPSTVVRGAWCQALFLPRPPVLWSGLPGFRCACVFVCVLCFAGSGGPASRARSGAPHLFLWPLCLSALLGPLRAGVAPLSLAALAVPRCLGAVLWFFFSASRCLALRPLAPRLCLLLGRWLLFGGFSPQLLPFCVSLFSSLLLGALVLLLFFFFFFFFFSFFFFPPLRAPVVSGFLLFPAPGALGLGAVRFLLCWPSASRLSVHLSLFRAFRLAGGCSPSVAAPPPPFLSRGFGGCRSVLCAVCCVVLCIPGCGAAPRCCALCSPVLCCSVLCCARWVPLLVAPCPLALPVALGPCALRRCVLWCSPVLCVFCRGAVVRAVVRRSALCCVCPGVLCCAFPVLSALCGAVPRCAGAPALCCSCGACCCWRLVLWCAVVRCWVCWPVVAYWWRVSVSVSLSGRVVCFPAVGVVCCGALLSCVVFCGAVLSRGAVLLCSAVVLRCCWGLLCPPVGCRAVLCCAAGWLCFFFAGGSGCVLWCSSPRAVRSLSSPLCALRCLVVLAVVPCFPVSCAVALCCRVVLCCRALLSFCGAVCVCFALLRPVVRRQCRLRCCWCLVLWRVPVRCGVSLGVLRCGGAALVCRGVSLCCALSCGVLRPVPCPAVPCRLAGFVSCVGVVVPT